MITLERTQHEAGSIVEIPLADLTIDPRLQKRPELSPEHIEDLKNALKNGDLNENQIDPVDVFQGDDGNLLADGFHRYEVFKSAGILTIAAKIHHGNFEEAEWFACSVNQHRNSALKRDRATIERQIDAALLNPKSKGMSNLAIAEHIGTNEHKVADRRKKLEEQGRLEPSETRIVTRNGKSYEQKVSNIGKRPNVGLEEAMHLWRQVGEVKPHIKKKSFLVENDRFGSPFPIVLASPQAAIEDWAKRGEKLLDHAMREGITPLKTGDRVEVITHVDPDLIGRLGTIVGILDENVERVSQFWVEFEDGFQVPCKPIDLKLAPVIELEEEPENEPEELQHLEVGDRVLTPRGYGTIVRAGEQLAMVRIDGNRRPTPFGVADVEIASKAEKPEIPEALADLPPLEPAIEPELELEESQPDMSVTMPTPNTLHKHSRVSVMRDGQPMLGQIIKVIVEFNEGDRVTLNPDQVEFV